MGAPDKEHLFNSREHFCYLLQFNGKRFHVSDKYKGIAIRTVCKRVKDPIQDRLLSKKYSYHKN